MTGRKANTVTVKRSARGKSLSMPKLEKKLDRVFSEYIRKRDCDIGGTTQCVTCNVYKYWKEVDAGHFVKRQHRSVRWDERNVHPQCTRCNHFMGGRQDDMAAYIIQKYGDSTFKELMSLKYQAKKHTRIELEQMIVYYQQKIEKLNV